MTVGMGVTRLAVVRCNHCMFFIRFIVIYFSAFMSLQGLAVLHSSAARMKTVSATLLCVTLSMTVETIVMNLDVVSQNIKYMHIS